MDNLRINGNLQGSVFGQKLKSDKSEIESFAPKFKEFLEEKDTESLKKVATQFEELFVNLILKTMRSGIQKTDLTDSSYQKDIFDGMLDETYSKEIAKTGGLGIADMLMKSFEPYLNGEVKEHSGSKIDIKG